jgi:hypothetical protein
MHSMRVELRIAWAAFLMRVHAAGVSVGGSVACVCVATASLGPLVPLGGRCALLGANVAALHVCQCALLLAVTLATMFSIK